MAAAYDPDLLRRVLQGITPDPTTGTATGPGAGTPQAKPGDVGYSRGALDQRGRDFAKPGPGAARQRVNVTPKKPKLGKAKGAAGALATYAVVGGIANTLADRQAATDATGNIAEALQRGGIFSDSPRARAYTASVLNVLQNIGNQVPGVQSFGDVLRIGTAPTTSPQPAVQAPAKTAVQPQDTAAASTKTPVPAVTQITNPDGSVSFTNVPSAVKRAANTGATVTPKTEDTLFQTPGVVTGRTGGFGVAQGVTPAERGRALSAAIRDRQFHLARGIANTPEMQAQVDFAEKEFDIQNRIDNARSPARLQAAVNDLNTLRTLQAVQAQVGGAKAAAVLKAIQAGPTAAKDYAKANLDTARFNEYTRLSKAGNHTEALAVLLGQAEKPFNTVISGLGSQPDRAIQVRGTTARELPVEKLYPLGTEFKGPNNTILVVTKDGLVPKK